MSLKQYRLKRDFQKTPEPKGKVVRGKDTRFVVQEHWATHHHFDFRLEMEGVLKSWAVPKGLPDKFGVKRLAVQVENHPLDYISFSGQIPESSYGAGRVQIYDKGDYELLDKTKESLTFILKGKKLKGKYHLVKTKGIGGTKQNQWLIFKGK